MDRTCCRSPTVLADGSRCVTEPSTQTEVVMARLVIEIPSDLSSLEQPIQALVSEVADRIRRAGSSKAVPYADVEREFADRSAAIERAAHGVMLAALDIDSEYVRIGDGRYSRVGRYPQTYRTLGGPVQIERSIYRQEGVRNGRTVDVVSMRTGALPNGWLPQTARAMSYLLAQGPSREAETTSRELGRLPYSRSSFERVGHLVGDFYVGVHQDVEEELRAEMVVPSEARSVSISVDRVSVPMEEPRPRPVGRPSKNAPKNPCERVYRMAYCATLTLHDREGDALQTIRLGRMPQGDLVSLCEGLEAELQTVLKQKNRLKVILLADGAPELWSLLEERFNECRLGRKVFRLIDLWHMLEKLGAAARVIHRNAEEADALLRRWRMRLMNSSKGALRLLDELYDSGCEWRCRGESRPVHEAITYIENNWERMDYASARRRGLPVGSGAVEATCKSLMAQRLKRSGSRWHEDTGEHVVQLRAVLLSDRWDAAMRALLDGLATPVRRAA